MQNSFDIFFTVQMKNMDPAVQVYGTVGYLVLISVGFVFYALIDAPDTKLNHYNKDIRTVALIIAIVNLVFPGLGLLNILLWAVSTRVARS